MNVEWVRRYCLSLPYTTETLQWSDKLVFKIGGKMYAVVALEPGKDWLSFKCSDEQFATLTEHPDVVPAPYLARAHWVALQTETALPREQIKRLLRHAYELVSAKLPGKVRASLSK